MARWYSKQRKQRMNGDFLKYGFIPGRGRIALEQKPCHFASHLDLCEFTGDCDFCNHARKDDPCYASITHYGEGGSEADFYICKHCLRSKHHARYIGEEGYHQGYSKFNQWKRRAALAPEQHICDYCDSVVTGDCDCKGARLPTTYLRVDI